MPRPRLTYANVVSTAALVLAAAGGTAVAVNAVNADKVDGVNAAKIDFVKPARGGPGKPLRTVMNQGGLALRARCYQQSGNFIDLVAKSRRNNAQIQVGVVHDNVSAKVERGFDRDFDKGEALDITSLGTGSQGEVTLTYSTPGGSHVSAVFQMDVGAIFGDATQKDCLIGGSALHVPG